MSKPYVISEIEIPASPEDVREVLLDFEHFAEIKSTVIRSITHRKGATGSVKKGEILDADFGIRAAVTVTENTPTTFGWVGIAYLLLGGKHNFYFLPSEKTPGQTLFRHEETPYRLSNVMFWLAPAQKLFDGPSRDFKARVVAVKGKGKGGVDGGV